GDADPLAFLLEQLDRTEVELDLGDVVDEGHGASLTIAVPHCKPAAPAGAARARHVPSAVSRTDPRDALGPGAHGPCRPCAAVRAFAARGARGVRGGCRRPGGAQARTRPGRGAAD